MRFILGITTNLPMPLCHSVKRQTGREAKHCDTGDKGIDANLLETCDFCSMIYGILLHRLDQGATLGRLADFRANCEMTNKQIAVLAQNTRVL